MTIQWLYAIPSHHATPFALSLGLCIFTLGFTSQTSPFRALGIIPMLSCMHLAMRTVRSIDDTHQLYKSVLVGCTANMVLQYLDSVLLSRWTYEARGPTSAIGGQTNLRTPSDTVLRGGRTCYADTFGDRLVFGWEEAFRARSAGTPWEIKHMPRFIYDRPDWLPSRLQFLYLATRRFFIGLLILSVISFLGRDATMNSVHFAASRVPIFSRLQQVTLDEVVIRFMSSVLHWVTFFALMQAIYDASAIVVIALGLGHIPSWPPLFNHWRECWSVRQFWGSFWQQGLRQKFQAPAHFLSFSILRLSKGTLFARYVVLTLTFAISAVFHQLGDVASGVPWQEAGAARFFIMQAIGIMIEDTFQGIYRKVMGKQRTEASPTSLKQLFGFVWVLVWLTWTTPVWGYPIAQRSSGEGVLPLDLWT